MCNKLKMEDIMPIKTKILLNIDPMGSHTVLAMPKESALFHEYNLGLDPSL